jgi:hypothetical protein
MVYRDCKFADGNNWESAIYRYDLETGIVGTYVEFDLQFFSGVKAIRMKEGYVSLLFRRGALVIQIEEDTGRALAANVSLPDNRRIILDGKCERTGKPARSFD